METDIILVVFVVAVSLVLLAMVQLFLASRHDRAITAAGPIEELAIYAKRLEEKRLLMADLEEEIEKRREAMAVVADLGAEVDGLRRQKEDLLEEWEQLRQRRDEVLGVRQEVEAALTERMALESEIAPLRAEFNSIKERLEKAEVLVGQIDRLTADHHAIAEKVEAMRDELHRLEDAEKQVEILTDRKHELEGACARIEGRVQAQADELEEVSTRVAAERATLADAQARHGGIEAELAAISLELRRTQGEIEGLGEARAGLEARLAHLRAEIAKAEGRTVDGDGTEKEDQLRELKVAPPVILAIADWEPAPRENEADALHRVERRLKAKGLEYPSRTLRAFHTAMKVNETTQMAVLAGISGTGKSQLPRQYAAGMGIGFLQVPVQPRWDSPQDLMGFYNYIEGKFRPTDMARALWALDEINNEDAVKDRMMMILLDEMNLARVEYYFSDFLSRLESRPVAGAVLDKNERKDAEIELEIPKMVNPPRIFPGYNLLFAGTMNEDESTQSLSEKVVDRANILRFAAPKKIKGGHAEGTVEPSLALSRKTWQRWVRPISEADRRGGATQQVEKLVDLMKDFKRPFGHRLGRAIMAYVANYPEVEGARPFEDALADQVEMRLLPKLRGIEVETASAEFTRLEGLVRDEFGDDKLAEAINASIQLANDGTGQFVWTGVTR
ncbi:chromosome segregation ATPase-like protein [Rhodobacter sp. Har01]|uniref:chromosome segregation ATPase-like protein n=1 Tax=Rhodobacter sp. Har01 TaxID=2883999 RepID=UPI001D060DCC|nr:chromosome segregation ATPase-like protein [Rhodobacter sp. Har01]MCB6179020.1 chromosome segregation ATPase-like protein [Rhodobacter sp. Har01]